MENAINTLRIQNFKSIKDVTMHPRRVNLIIGMPNVGKSNILEAMSLLGGLEYERNLRFMGSYIRYEEPRQLFYDNLFVNPILIETDSDLCFMGRSYDKTEVRYLLISRKSYDFLKEKIDYKIDNKLVITSSSTLELDFFEEEVLNKISKLGFMPSFIYLKIKAEYSEDNIVGHINFAGGYGSKYQYKYYLFNKGEEIDKEENYKFLSPPSGRNLLSVIQSHSKLRKNVSNLFEPYKLKLSLRLAERKLEVTKDLDGVVYSYPYSGIADTLQRMIFYLAAIESNDDSVLLFEEPEAHTFPVYTSMLGRKIAASHNNQFFIATHSPYLVTEILEQMLPEEGQEGELAIFLAYYEDYQTKVKQLSNEEIREIRNDSIDVFYNLSRFTPGSNSYA